MLEMLRQKTVCTAASMRGKALHCGQEISVTLRPAPPDAGVVFNRIDVKRAKPIEAVAHNVVDTSRATTLGFDDLRVATVEHLLSALRGLGVDNVYVDVDGPELPAGDGSSATYVELIKRAGLQPQAAARRIAVLRKTIEVRDGDKWARLSPSSRFTVDCRIDFEHPLIGEQRLQVDFTDTSYEREVAGARTFAFFHEVEWLRSQGLAQGGSLDNCIVIDGDHILNTDGLRYADEFVRHKVLDVVGDLALYRPPLICKMTCHKTGHELHRKLIQALIADDEACTVVVPRAARSLTRIGVHLPDWAPASAPLAA